MMTKKELEDVVHAYYDDILRYFVCRVRDRSLAEDLTQETFYRFIKYASYGVHFASEKKCRAYLYTVAANVCRDHWSKNTVTEELDENIPAPDDDRDTSYVLEAALAKLPDVQREAALLYYYSGFSVREIAVIQSATVSAVKSRLKAARDTLGKILSKEGIL